MSIADPVSPRLIRAQAAREIFEKKIRALVQPEQQYWYLAIDVKSGGFALDEDDQGAVSKLREQFPDADGFLMRADGAPAYRMRRI
jgi:hypothetical protein